MPKVELYLRECVNYKKLDIGLVDAADIDEICLHEDTSCVVYVSRFPPQLSKHLAL